MSGSRDDPKGAHFEIRVDGIVRSHRDVRETAMTAARFLQGTGAKVTITDLRDGSDVPFNDPVK
jgi:hypothetical protein